MANKFGRNYQLSVEATDGGTIIITPPFSIDFDISRASFSSANTASFRIVNIGAQKRNQIRKDQYDYGNQKVIKFQAGYGSNLSTAFTGSVYKAWSVRDGTSFVTQLECFDGGYAFANAGTSQAFPAGTAQQTVIQTLVEQFKQYGVDPGAVGTYEGSIGRGNSYAGSTANILQDLTGGGFFIDNQKANCLNDNECIAGPVRVIDASTGLLGTPVRETNYVNFNILFEPQLAIGQRIKLVSSTDTNFNTEYIIKSLKHKGTISAALSGIAVTSVGCIPGNFIPVSPAVR